MAANKPARLEPWRPGVWRFPFPDGAHELIAGVSDRSCDLAGLRERLAPSAGMALAEQTHGASLTAVDLLRAPDEPLPGCDGLTTNTAHLALIIRTADCLPIILWDPVKRVAGALHAGWRGLWRRLPLRMLAFLRQLYQSHAEDLWVGIGPAIRPCCYEVGDEFRARFGRFVTRRRGRLVCDLIGCAKAQLIAGGVRPSRVIDAGQCTACHPARWYSVRREGECGRLLSFVSLQ